MTWRVGFLEESEGVRSMCRLSMAWLLGLASAVVLTLCWYVIHLADKAQPLVVTSLAGVLGALVANGIVAIVKRNGAEAPPT